MTATEVVAATLPGVLVSTLRYVYHDENGAAVGRVVRKDYRLHDGGRRKVIWQERPDAAAGWQTGKGHRAVPYRLPAVLAKAAAGGVVFVTEGEKCCEAVVGLGLEATTNAQGAGKWTHEHAAYLLGAHVVVLPDNDAPGHEHAELVARTCTTAGARSVRVVSLPGLSAHGDVCDWIAAGGTLAALERLVRAAPLWKALAQPRPPLPRVLRALPSRTSMRLHAPHSKWDALKERAKQRPVRDVFRDLGIELKAPHDSKSQEWTFRCPFHHDRSASGSVNVETGLWRCYAASCQKAGDIFDLVEQRRHCDFPAAVRELAL